VKPVIENWVVSTLFLHHALDEIHTMDERSTFLSAAINLVIRHWEMIGQVSAYCIYLPFPVACCLPLFCV
jgi:hypothetical protein